MSGELEDGRRKKARVDDLQETNEVNTFCGKFKLWREFDKSIAEESCSSFYRLGSECDYTHLLVPGSKTRCYSYEPGQCCRQGWLSWPGQGQGSGGPGQLRCL